VNANESIEIAAQREQVFELLTDPELIPTWWPIIRRFEPRLGGRFELDEAPLSRSPQGRG
jgi:uncharacterized protein YndB with AHSA1/START domain